ncbi:thiamine biosynthesis protein ThiS [Flavonifractor sp. An82]|uniref:sulfur carrier protein ThiS n=1 Tax=Flavonifractor sp. An82 TaxID=1965660 RepID=UPI000B37BB06|nr:sulfur carrier protein ThiS [Flavonifractor sp. An82]OUN22598.1 thiamine biosynthesis protein ThiS [Flavonifractor sp. An82]
MLQVNGETMDRSGLNTVQDLLDKQGWKADRVAVEHNGAILKRDDFSTTVLSDGDKLEVVRFVGGG